MGDRRRRPVPFVVIGNPGTRRIDLFQSALRRLGLPPARVVSYADLIAGRDARERQALPGAVRPGAVVRIESPDQDFGVERAILALGADAAGEDGCDSLPRAVVERLPFEPGRMLSSRQWYLGLCEALRLIERQLADCPDHQLMNHPADVAVMFDKRRCHERLLRCGVPVPQSLGPVGSYDELVERMRRAGCYRVFVKPAHGSSACGVVAYQTNGREHHATTTVEMERRGKELCLFTSRRLRVYRDVREIAELVDALCRQRVHVERWLPKAGIDDRTFDLRVVVIAGQAKHVVVRSSRGPLTNLHLGNARASAERVRAKMGEAAWDAACRTCERALACFAGSLYAGIDLLISPGFRRHAILEVNAFGDLLLDTYCDGLDTYTAEVLALLAGGRGAEPADGAELALEGAGWSTRVG